MVFSKRLPQRLTHRFPPDPSIAIIGDAQAHFLNSMGT